MRRRRVGQAARAESGAPAPTSAGRVPPAGPIPAAWRYPRSSPWTTASDVVIALAFLFLSLIGRPEAELGIVQGVTPALYLLMLGTCALAMAVRRRSPMLFVLVAGVCLAVHLVLFTEFSIFFVVTAFIAVETTQSRLEAPWRWAGLALELAGAAAATTRAHELIGDQVHAGAGRLILLTNAWLVVAVAAFVGAARRRSRDRYNRAFERATVLEAQQAAERRLAVIETQQRIARDVHDLLGHSLTVIAMQAEGARAILATDPAAAAEALAVIGETSRRSVDEVRALVDMLRSGAADGAADVDTATVDAAAAPGSGSAAGSGSDVHAAGAGGLEAADIDTAVAPGFGPTSGSGSDAGTSGVDGSGAAGRPTGGTSAVADIVDAGSGAAASDRPMELLREPVRQAQRAGLPVALEIGPVGRIPSAMAQVLHRVAQESLTNVLRHAPGASTTVTLRSGADRAVLVVENAPVPAAPPASSTPVTGTPDSDGGGGDGDSDGQSRADRSAHRGFGQNAFEDAESRADRPAHRGFGLIGMRDRVADLGGSFTAGPTDEGGWRAMAELPIVPE